MLFHDGDKGAGDQRLRQSLVIGQITSAVFILLL
jgi:hypothetical protein